ncbi:MAG TPA: aminotransferase class I/II-fold pyridoxal phosphate-dependent enzyme [Candidatus Aminicenantes bacterium]|nr:aminotransferase class I/II-fold pyridoxal phosphate-dependent enzyme [Candidatus Aminicenantes bacterium]HRY65319.1 aminotransferase class I/II-fold pyridoxal phosphate-dependent enzyme [Candidatus Aminicenantes bacterium]HRZ72213.1 aminotransferase class I/II-fold pyridoxal phosphate-dependent enzyme [Candidatus Aminicenantes bacterium]
MRIDTFKMERMQSSWENVVDYNLSESGVHPLSLKGFLTPAEIGALTEVELGYSQTNGTIPLRQAIARLYPGIGPDQILTTAGSSEANFLLMWSLVEPGDEVLFEMPNYMQMAGLLRAFGAEVKAFRLHESLDWQPDLDEMRKLITPKTKLIVLTNPNNPTGSVLAPEIMDGIVGLAADAGAWILADEVYQGAELDGETTPSFWGRWEKTLVVNGLSKAYGLPGLRIGWIVGPEDAVRRTWPYHDYTTISPSALSDRLAAWALSPGTRERILARTRGILNANFPVLGTWLSDHGGLFSFRPPRAGAICFARYALAANSTELVERLIREHSVLVVPGDHFETDGYLRFGYGPEKGYLLRALGRIDEMLKKNAQSW